jgi:hypothetical protein
MPFLESRKRITGLLVIVAILSVAGYLLSAALTYRLGFPLDDSWIHQTYARNLATYGEWSFVPHQTSGGSTSPLWTVLLVPGVWLHLSPLPWAYALGVIILSLLAVLSEFITRWLVPEYRTKIPWIGLFIALEWHLVWAAASGMETLLSALAITGVLAMLALGSSRFLLIGLIIGLGLWIRPDIVTLMGPAFLAIFLSRNSPQNRLNSVFRLLIGFGIAFGFYLLFNLVVAGTPFPNTFYAKQTEYAILLKTPFYLRITRISILPLTGAGALLLPGVGLMLYRGIKEKNWGVLLGMIWFVGYITLYALRLPVTYQHGRYIMPAMPIFFIWGLSGMFIFSSSFAEKRIRWVINKAWQVSTGVALIAFWFLGAKAYGTDVAIIESEMVTTAKWVAANIPSDNLIAAHDIGALGYFAPRPLVDLAGLVSPEVIPFIRDEDRLEKYLNESDVQYLISFPDWYSSLTKGHPLVFTTQGKFAPRMGEMNMVVYSWSTP